MERLSDSSRNVSAAACGAASGDGILFDLERHIRARIGAFVHEIVAKTSVAPHADAPPRGSQIRLRPNGIKEIAQVVSRVSENFDQ